MQAVRNAMAAIATALMVSFVAQPVLAADDEIDITFLICTDPGINFWNPAIKGAEDAAEMLGANLDIQYGDNDPLKLKQIFQTAILNEVEGFALSTCVSGVYIDEMEEAREAGIGVVVFNTNDPGASDWHVFVGQNLWEGGTIIGRDAIERIGLKAGDHVMVAAGCLDCYYAQQRYGGIKVAMDEAGISSELIGTSFVLAEATTGQAQYLIGHPETDAVMGVDNPNSSTGAAAVEEAGMDIRTSGFDISEQIVANIEAGKMVSSLDQQPYYQGFMTVTMLYHWAKYGIEPSDVDTGNNIIDASKTEVLKPYIGTYR